MQSPHDAGDDDDDDSPQPMRPDDSGKVQSILSVEPWRHMKMGNVPTKGKPGNCKNFTGKKSC